MTPLRGQLVLVVGPSGAGKDTLIDHARRRLGADQQFHFIRRTVTRPPAVGEDYETIDIAEFERRVKGGSFALHWQAHDIFYGLPTVIRDWMARGGIVVANGSRAAVPQARSRFPDLHVVTIVVPPTIIAARLRARGRETEAMIADRLARQPSVEAVEIPTYEIDNSGSPEAGGEALIRILLAIKSGRRSAP
ncbi:phosphonate metabolism protein/1,5-bisphosphokinase (PRPP-forming) PhnN [Chelatococcus sp. GCM10030263]|uniref:phosphonate metabolism protein/1,5-bisphosphokinase (PRPP-forming) PhnN n=1 Tax=Chelatococcus sp. GCM10030263 TaxID=3273387 RepID=UPI00361DB126